MALQLNKLFACVAAILLLQTGYAQVQNGQVSRETVSGNNNDPEQFENFNRRRHLISAWRIHELKDGALVVRLKTNQLLVDELKKAGNDKLATQKLAEQFAINKNIMFAYLDNFKFCKLYFIYSHSSDTLLNGARSGIFLDTNLRVDPAVTMNEDFYLIAERDHVYSSSSGLVPEDSARKVLNSGMPLKEMAVVIKNKYGHQLISPFPYQVSESTFFDSGYFFPFKVVGLPDGGIGVEYTVDKTYLSRLENGREANKRPEPRYAGGKKVEVKKHLTYEKLSAAVKLLDDKFFEYYRAAPKPQEEMLTGDIRKYLY